MACTQFHVLNWTLLIPNNETCQISNMSGQKKSKASCRCLWKEKKHILDKTSSYMWNWGDIILDLNHSAYCYTTLLTLDGADWWLNSVRCIDVCLWIVSDVVCKSKDCYFNCSISPVVHGGYSSWGQWGSCDVSCGGGTRYRYRDPQHGGDDCSGLGSNAQTEVCNSNNCPSKSFNCIEI